MNDITQAAQTSMQPLLKLTEANMALIARFFSSSDAVNQTSSNIQQMVEQAQKTTTALVQSNAFGHLSQGMWKNYIEFVTEFGNAAMSALTQGQFELTRQAQETGSSMLKTIATRSKAAS